MVAVTKEHYESILAGYNEINRQRALTDEEVRKVDYVSSRIRRIIRETEAAYRQKHREKRNEACRQWRKDNPEAYEASKQKSIALEKAVRAMDKGLSNPAKLAYWLAVSQKRELTTAEKKRVRYIERAMNADEQTIALKKERFKKYRENEDVEKRRARNKRFRDANREKIKAYKAKQRAAKRGQRNDTATAAA